MENQNKVPTVFISYSWDSNEHKKMGTKSF